MDDILYAHTDRLGTRSRCVGDGGSWVDRGGGVGFGNHESP